MPILNSVSWSPKKKCLGICPIRGMTYIEDITIQGRTSQKVKESS